METLLIILEVILLFNLLILVHEAGHFFVARWRGLKVEKFAIWFGKPLFSKKIGEVEYSLGCIPAGGFVSIPQLAPMEIIEGKTDLDTSNLPLATPLDKILVALAGPVASFLLAVLFSGLVWIIGKPLSEVESTNIIGYVIHGGPADKAGLRPGDKILAVNNHIVKIIQGMGELSDSVAWNIAKSSAPIVSLLVDRNGKKQNIDVKPVEQPKTSYWNRKNLRQIKIIPSMTSVIAAVIPNSPAEYSGLKVGDIIVSANNEHLFSPLQLSDIIKKNSSIDLLIKRDNSILHVVLNPRIPEGGVCPVVGIYWKIQGLTVLVYPTPLHQIKSSVMTIWETFSALIRPHSEIHLEQMSGPVGIMRIYYFFFENPMGWRLAIWFTVILNVNLALINLFPLPVLDGGHIILALLELILRHPINKFFVEKVQIFCSILLILFMVYVSFFDISDFLDKNKKLIINEQNRSVIFRTHHE